MDSIASKKLHHHHPAISATHRCLSYSQNNYRDLISAHEPGGHHTAAYGMKEASTEQVSWADAEGYIWTIYVCHLSVGSYYGWLFYSNIVSWGFFISSFCRQHSVNTRLYTLRLCCMPQNRSGCLELFRTRRRKKKEMFEWLEILWNVDKVKIDTELNGFSQRLTVERSAVPRISIKAIFCMF